MDAAAAAGQLVPSTDGSSEHAAQRHMHANTRLPSKPSELRRAVVHPVRQWCMVGCVKVGWGWWCLGRVCAMPKQLTCQVDCEGAARRFDRLMTCRWVM